MKIAVMQPYFFPYMGYYQLVNHVDCFVFFDDVNFMKRGWINRNRVCIGGSPRYITIPLQRVSQNHLICETRISNEQSWRDTFKLTIERAYKKTKSFDTIYPLFCSIIDNDYESVAEIAAQSILQVMNLLDIKTKTKFSSQIPIEKTLKGAERILAICKYEGADEYVNAYGGITLYENASFDAKQIQLSFVKMRPFQYEQHAPEFIPNLSILDVLMCNEREAVKSFLSMFDIV